MLSLSVTREHAVQIQPQHEPRQIITNYSQTTPPAKERSIQHQIIQVKNIAHKQKKLFFRKQPRLDFP